MRKDLRIRRVRAAGPDPRFSRAAPFRFSAVAVLAPLLLAPPFFDAALMGAGNPPDEEVVVTANAYPVPFGNLSRTVSVLTREDIAELPVHSIPDILAHAGADIGSRAPSGMQADIRLRGSSFSQVLVLVDGVRLNDSQTGHHNADIPIPMEEIERIEVLLGPGSSIYGAEAFGGTVNNTPRAPDPGVRATVGAGAHGFAGGSFSAGIEKGALRQALGVAFSRSSGFRPDRDFHGVTLSARSRIGDATTLAVSHADREFGAEGFYGPAPSREWTNQTLVSLSRSHQAASGVRADVRGWYRTHGDRFLYDVRTPGLFESRHRTHATGVSARALKPLGDSAALTLGGEAGADWIASTSLGDHSFAWTSLFAELGWSAGKRAFLYPGIRVDRYSRFGSALSPSLSGGLWVTKRIRLRSSIGRAFRIPTFTELYYRDPNHEASPRLGPERAWSAELVADFIPPTAGSGPSPSSRAGAGRHRLGPPLARGEMAHRQHPPPPDRRGGSRAQALPGPAGGGGDAPRSARIRRGLRGLRLQVRARLRARRLVLLRSFLPSARDPVPAFPHLQTARGRPRVLDPRRRAVPFISPFHPRDRGDQPARRRLPGDPGGRHARTVAGRHPALPSPPPRLGLAFPRGAIVL